MLRLQTVQFGVRIPEEAKDFSLFQNVHIGSGAHSAYPRWLQGFFRGGNAVRAEDNHTPPSTTEIKNEWR